ncbi:MAG: hypothetical protein U5O39_08405 [Gammaproteobacteria bacterium]|nr:hypothetical protein [Gammaproteobacteria bacterium]
MGGTVSLSAATGIGSTGENGSIEVSANSLDGAELGLGVSSSTPWGPEGRRR